MQKRIAAVLAHYDPDGGVHSTFEDTIAGFLAVAEQVVVVSTSNSDNSEASKALRDPRVSWIHRPNIGYDFYSYRVGFEALRDTASLDGVFFANSSFVVCSQDRFVSTLTSMQQLGLGGTLVGATESQHKQHHIQSYLFFVPQQMTASDWFLRWMGAVEPKDSKAEVISAYELGLSAEAKRQGIPLRAAFSPTGAERSAMWRSSARAKLRSNGILRALAHVASLRCFAANPTHFAAEGLAARHGIVKLELLRDNPHGLSLEWLPASCSESNAKKIEALLERAPKAGQRPGPSPLPSVRIIPISANSSLPADLAVVVHAYYVDPLPELRQHLLHFTEPFDLFVTTPHESDVPYIVEQLQGCAASLTIVLSENRGRDVGPFISLLRAGNLEQYRAVLKLHLKKSFYSAEGNAWRQSLLRELCGDAVTIRRCSQLLRQGDVGLIGPQQYFLTHDRFWGANLEQTRVLLAAAGAISNGQRPALAFFAGSMFWFSPAALSALCSIPESKLSFPAETGLQDGTLAHALERAFAMLARSRGFRVTSPALNGIDIHSVDCSRNTVPVL